MISKRKLFLIFGLLIFVTTSVYSAEGYELFYDGKRKAHKTNMSLYQSVGNLQAGVKKYRSIKVTGYYDSIKIYAHAKGYELYHNGRRVGYKPNWSLKEAVNHLHRDKKSRKNMDIRGWYNGNKM